MSDFDALFASFWRRAFDAPSDLNVQSLRFDLGRPDRSVELAMADVTARATAVLDCERPLRDVRQALLTMPAIRSQNLRSEVERRLAVRARPSRTFDEEFMYVKINHGFWEQMYWLCAPVYDEASMRPHDRDLYERSYARSGFVRALFHLIREAAREVENSIGFPSLSFGFSLSNGDEDHAHVLERFDLMESQFKPVVLGAAAGSLACLQSLFGARRCIFDDGSLPKCGLRTGELEMLVAALTRDADRICFVTPPHLAGVRLSMAPQPHQQMFVSGTLAHEGWLAGLYATSAALFERLRAGETIVVFAQAAVFAALLGLFMRSAALALRPPGRLRFLDLGQVLDIAAPTAGGRWAQRNWHGGSQLFALA